MNKFLPCMALSLLFLHATNFTMSRVAPDDEYNRALQRNHDARTNLHERVNQPVASDARIIDRDNNLIDSSEYPPRRKIIQKSFCSTENEFNFIFANGSRAGYSGFQIIDYNIEIQGGLICNYIPCDCKHCTTPNNDNGCCTIS